LGSEKSCKMIQIGSGPQVHFNFGSGRVGSLMQLIGFYRVERIGHTSNSVYLHTAAVGVSVSRCCTARALVIVHTVCHNPTATVSVMNMQISQSLLRVGKIAQLCTAEHDRYWYSIRQSACLSDIQWYFVGHHHHAGGNQPFPSALFPFSVPHFFPLYYRVWVSAPRGSGHSAAAK